jgi:hypothetical protein
MHEARAALAKGLAQSQSGAEAVAVVTPMITPDAAPLLSLRDPGAALGTLERALAMEGRRDESLVARELRAIAGGLDDGAHVELRARRLSYDGAAPAPVVFDRTSLRSALVPQPEGQSALLDVAAAIAGAEAKIVRMDLDDIGVSARDRVPPNAPSVIGQLVTRISRMLGIERPELVVSDQLTFARAAIVKEAPWVVAPESLSVQSEPMQIASLTRVLVRVALSVPWLEQLPVPHAHALLCGAVRIVVPDYASELRDATQQDLIDDYMKRLSRAVSRKHKKALAELAPIMAETIAPSVAEVDALGVAIGRAELRAAFVLTGDLLATLDELRMLDAGLSRDTSHVGPRALAAALAHPLAGDLARFALSPAATAMRWRAGTLWGGAR